MNSSSARKLYYPPVCRTPIGLSQLAEDLDNGPSHPRHQQSQNLEDLSRASDWAQLGLGPKHNYRVKVRALQAQKLWLVIPDQARASSSQKFGSPHKICMLLKLAWEDIEPGSLFAIPWLIFTHGNKAKAIKCQWFYSLYCSLKRENPLPSWILCNFTTSWVIFENKFME